MNLEKYKNILFYLIDSAERPIGTDARNPEAIIGIYIPLRKFKELINFLEEIENQLKEIKVITGKKVIILVNCIHCNESYPIKVDPMDFSKWMTGEELIQDIMPYLNAGERELLISNTCDTCWDNMFGNTEEDEDQT